MGHDSCHGSLSSSVTECDSLFCSSLLVVLVVVVVVVAVVVVAAAVMVVVLVVVHSAHVLDNWEATGHASALGHGCPK